MGKVYASADWHGCGDLGMRVLNWLSADDKLIFIGDAIDRNPDGIKLFDALYSDPRIIYLKGNHEDMMERVLIQTFDEEAWYRAYISDDITSTTWFMNGGEVTWKDLENKSEPELKGYINKIKNLKKEYVYNSPNGHTVILEHAGYTPGLSNYNPLWNREHFQEYWQKGDKYSNIYMVHGHTPIQYLKYYYGYIDQKPFSKEEFAEQQSWIREEQTDAPPQILYYCNNRKVDIDMCTIVSNRIALLDLDTFEEIYFDKES